MSFYNVAQTIVTFILSFRFHITIIDKEKLPKKQGFIIASNHRSYCDPLFIGLGFRRHVHFMAKEELFKNIILRPLLKWLGAFPVSRGHGDQTAINNAIDTVQNGGILGIFPEGTRSKDGNLGRAKSGAVVVAAKTGGDIMPVGIYYGKRRFIRRQLTIIYGDMIKNKALGVVAEMHKTELKAANAILMDSIAALLQRGKMLDEKESDK